MEDFRPRRWSHTQSQHPMVMPAPLWPLTLPLQQFAHLHKHKHTLTGQQGSLRGTSVWVWWKSDSATFTPIKSVSSQEHMKGMLWGTLFTSLYFYLLLFFLFSSSYPLKVSCPFSIRGFDPTSDFSVSMSPLLPWQ